MDNHNYDRGFKTGFCDARERRAEFTMDDLQGNDLPECDTWAGARDQGNRRQYLFGYIDGWNEYVENGDQEVALPTHYIDRAGRISI